MFELSVLYFNTFLTNSKIPTLVYHNSQNIIHHNQNAQNNSFHNLIGHIIKVWQQANFIISIIIRFFLVINHLKLYKVKSWIAESYINILSLITILLLLIRLINF